MHVVSARQLPDALASERFERSSVALLVPDALLLKGFDPPSIDMDLLDGACSLRYLMKGYPFKVTISRIGSDGKVSINACSMVDRICYIFGAQMKSRHISPCELEQELVGRQHSRRWQMCCDARHSDRTHFTIPDAVDDVSMEAEYSRYLPNTWDDRSAHDLQVSESGVVVPFQQGATWESVFIYVVKGCKTFYLVVPTEENQVLFDTYVGKGRSDLFFGGHDELEKGCQKIVVKERQALILPGGMMYLTETTGLTVSISE